MYLNDKTQQPSCQPSNPTTIIHWSLQLGDGIKNASKEKRIKSKTRASFINTGNNGSTSWVVGNCLWGWSYCCTSWPSLSVLTSSGNRRGRLTNILKLKVKSDRWTESIRENDKERERKKSRVRAVHKKICSIQTNNNSRTELRSRCGMELQRIS